MADAELRFRAVLQDDASRGMDALDQRVQQSGAKAAQANKDIGRSATTAARETGKAAGDIGSAYRGAERSVANSASRIGQSITNAVRGTRTVVATAAKRGRELGSSLVQGVSQGMKGLRDKLVTGVGDILKSTGAKILGAAGIGGFIAAGMSRLTALEDARFKLEALGHSAQSVETIMTNALASVKGTSFGLGEAANVAASVVAAGIKPGQDLERVLRLTADAAAVAGVSMGDMGSIIGQVAATGKAQGDVIAQLGDRGIPILQLIAEEMGVTAAEAGKMASEGKVNFEIFTSALENGMAGAAKSMGDTFSGTFANMRAAIGRLSAELLGPLMEPLKTVMNNIITWADSAAASLSPLAETIGQNVAAAMEWLGEAASIAWERAQPFLTWAQQNRDVFQALAIGIGAAATATGVWAIATAGLAAAWAVIASPIVVIGAFIATLVLAYQKVEWFRNGVNAAWAFIKDAAALMVEGLRQDWVILQTAWEIAVTAIRTSWAALGDFFGPIWEGIKTGAQAAVDFIRSAWETLSGAAITIWTTIRDSIAAVTNWFSTVASVAWDTALRVLGDTTTWLHQNIVQPAWDGIRIAIAVVVGTIITLWEGFVWVMRNTLGPAFTWLYENVVLPVWNGIQTAIDTVIGWFTTTAVPSAQTSISIFEQAWQAFRGVVETVWNAIRTAINTAWSFIRDSVLQPAMNFIQGPLTNTWNTFRALIETVWTVIRTVSTNAWNFLRDSVFQPTIDFVRGALTAAWTFIRDHITNMWTNIRDRAREAWNFILNNVFQPIVNYIRQPLGDAWTFVRDRVTDTWTSIRDRIGDAWNHIRNNIFAPMHQYVTQTIPDAFRSARDAIGTIWDGIKAKISGPIEAVIGFIRDRLIGNINRVLDALGMNPISFGGSFGSGPSGMAMPPGYRNGGYTGAGNPNEAAGLVHRDEQVIRSPARRSIEARAPGFLDTLNRKGAAALDDPSRMAVGSPVYGGFASFAGGLQRAIASSGTLNVAGIAPGWNLPQAIGMMDRATAINVRAGAGGTNTVRVGLGNYPQAWAGYYAGNSIMLNNRIMGASPILAKQTVAAHEIGHALGLPHNMGSGLNSIMNYNNMYRHNQVTPADVAALSAIYGGTGQAGGGIDIIGILMDGIDRILNTIMSRFDGLGADIAIGAGKYLVNKAKEWAGGITGASRGTIIPGYSPGNDRVPVMTSPGESVLTPQLTNALGPRNIRAANLASTGNRAGGPGNAVGLLGLSGNGGGIQINLDITIEGNADMDAINQLESDLEPMLTRVLERSTRRGY